MRFFRQIRVRLTLWYMAMIVIMVGGVALFSYLRMSRYAFRYADGRLDGELVEAQTILNDEGLEGLSQEIKFQSRLGAAYATCYKVYGEDGGVLLQSKERSTFALLSPEKARQKMGSGKEYESVRLGEGEMRVLTASVKLKTTDARYLIQIGRSIKPEANLLENLTENLIMFIPAILLLSIVGGWLLARAGLKPMHRLSQEAAVITGERLHERLPVRGVGDEIDQHAEVLNVMLASLEASFTETRNFAARASHELRTPLTALQLQIESALHAEPAEARSILESALDNVARLASLVKKLLFLSRSKAEAADLKFHKLDFAELVSGVCTDAAVLAGQKSIALSLSAAERAEVTGEDVLLKQMVWNILDNAIKYSSEEKRIEVSVKRQAGDAVLTVRDEGPGISPADMPHVFEAFYRSNSFDGSDTQGFGLGLNISRWICETHRGSIALANNAGPGLAVTVRIPLAD